MAASLEQTTQIISGISFITQPHCLCQHPDKPKSFESRQNSFYTQGGLASCSRACFNATLIPQSCQDPNLLDGADHVGGQLHGDKECPFSGVTNSGRVWGKELDSEAWGMNAELSRNSPFSSLSRPEYSCTRFIYCQDFCFSSFFLLSSFMLHFPSPQ